MTEPRQAQLPLLLAISEGLSRGTDEMLRVSPQGDAIHPPSCSLAIREAVEEIKWLRSEIERDKARAVVWRQAKGIEDLRAEVERLTRERDEARAALLPFSELYLWPDDAGRLIAERVRSHEDWDEAANDEESNPYCILRGEIRAARKALESKP